MQSASPDVVNTEAANYILLYIYGLIEQMLGMRYTFRELYVFEVLFQKKLNYRTVKVRV